MNEDLIIPIYIDTNSLLDLLASIEGGFSVVEKVSSRTTQKSGIDRGVDAETGTEFGIPNVLSMLKIKIGYSAMWNKGQESNQEVQSERYHTYGSLFYRLREYLYSKEIIKELGSDPEIWGKIEPSDFVEVRGVFRPNPFANSLEILNRVINMFQFMTSVDTPARKPSVKGLPSEQKKKIEEEYQKKQEAERKQQDQLEQVKKVGGYVEGLLSDIQTEDKRAFVIDFDVPRDHKGVTFLFLDYLRDKTMTEISHKEYRLIGKVVRKIESDTDESIDFLLNTGLGGIGEEVLNQLLSVFDQMPGMNLPKVETEIPGPALEIVPIAIFV